MLGKKIKNNIYISRYVYYVLGITEQKSLAKFQCVLWLASSTKSRIKKLFIATSISKKKSKGHQLAFHEGLFESFPKISKSLGYYILFIQLHTSFGFSKKEWGFGLFVLNSLKKRMIAFQFFFFFTKKEHTRWKRFLHFLFQTLCLALKIERSISAVKLVEKDSNMQVNCLSFQIYLGT